MDTIIPESTEQEVSVEQENATFFVLGDAAYTSEIIEEYNRNAVNKTNEFNANSDTKVNEYNTNATNKTTAFNSNYDAKVADFNQNAENQTETFNSNAATQVNSFNANATTSIENYNANAEQKLYEFNANALSYEEGITDNSNRVKRLETDIFDSGTASGSSINIQDSTLAEFQELTMDGVSKQEIRSGKNKLYLPDETKTSHGITVTIKDGVISIKGTATSNYVWIKLTNNIDIKNGTPNPSNSPTWYGNSLIPAGTYTISSDVLHALLYSKTNDTENSTLISATSNTNTITIDEALSDIYFYVGASGTEVNLTFHLQIEEGEVATSWEQYGISPSPEFPAEIDVIDERFEFGSCSKNLYNYKDKDLTSLPNGVTIDDEGWITCTWDNTNSTTSKSLHYGTNNLSLKTETNYLIVVEVKNVSGTGDAHFVSKLWVSPPREGQFINEFAKKFVDLSSGGIYCKTIKTEADFSTIMSGLRTYIGYSAGESGSITFRISVLEDTSITADSFVYEPYQGTISTITLPDGEFAADGDLFRIAFNNEDGKYHLWLDKNIGKEVLNGTEALIYTNAPTDNPDGHQFIVDKILKNIKYIYGQTDCNLKCTHFIPTYWHQHWLKDNIIVQFTSVDEYNTGKVRIVTNIANTVETLQQYLKEQYDNGTPVEIYYSLAEPYSLDLGVIDMPISYYPVTNVFTTHDLQPIINVAYYRDIKNTITTMQTDIEMLKEAVATLTVSQTNLASEVDLLQEQTETESEVIE